MTTEIEQALRTRNAAGHVGLIPFVTVGYPDPPATLDIIEAIVEAGADVVELGVPFSDPLAEGATIQRTSFHALEQGVTPASCIALAGDLRARGVRAPLVLMGYYTPILAMGIDQFCASAADAGVQGLIVADLPAEEAGPLAEAAGARGLAIVPLLALTSNERRIARACERAEGFVYCVSVLGVTGARAQLSERVEELVGTVRRHTRLPVGVGFGVTTPEHVRELGRYADAAVVGSALLNAIGDGHRETAAQRAADFIRSLASGTSRDGE